MSKKKHITKAKPPSAFEPISVRSIRAKMIKRQKDRGLVTTLSNGDVRTNYQTTRSGVHVAREWANRELQKVEETVDKIIDTSITIGETTNDGIGNQSHKIHRLLAIWVERAKNSEVEKARKEAPRGTA
ncbi:MAG: hypothetical protein LN417_04225 [Candidatus Thermoplasmatota archaeon]|nr:hypothetical protein [Candidatus Thermoplasmatota archaeon]